MAYRLRVWLHDLTRRHYRFEQGTTEFYVCDRRWRWQRDRTEYTVAWKGHDPVSVTREQFVNLDARLRAEAVASLDEAIELLESSVGDDYDYDDYDHDVEEDS